MGNPSTSSGSHPGVPTWARGAADWLFGGEGRDVGLFPEAMAGQNNLGGSSILPLIASLLGPTMLGGSVQRDLSSGLTSNAISGSQNVGDKSQFDAVNPGSNPGMDYLSALIPQMFGASNDFAGNINQGESAINTGITGATTTLNNLMSPTYYNPLFQNAAANITPEINADFSSKGLGSSGAASAALGTAYSGLADKFAERQVQEQLGAQQGLNSLGMNLGQLGVAGAQVPSQVYGNFMSGLATGQNSMANSNLANQQGLAIAGQNQLLPLQASGLGSQQYWQGIQNPLSILGTAFGMGQQPIEALLAGVTGVGGGVTIPHQGWLGKALGK